MSEWPAYEQAVSELYPIGIQGNHWGLGVRGFGPETPVKFHKNEIFVRVPNQYWALIFSKKRKYLNYILNLLTHFFNLNFDVDCVRTDC